MRSSKQNWIAKYQNSHKKHVLINITPTSKSVYVKLYTPWIYIQNLHFPNINPLHSDPFALPATPSHVFYSQFLTTPQLSPPENHRTKCFYVIFYTRHMYVHIQHECMFLRIFAHFRVCFVAKLKQFDSITLCSSFHGLKVVGIH